MPISLTAPATPGTYMVYAALTEQFNCPDALALYNSTAATIRRRRIGVLVVR